ncbi:UNVERIFIED_CONTAM: hypothetical protein HDU68_002234 [Siphonaria sp. JEL0065]|nr:hypothetical protein HDU68_002234 [Siphonaria sp. JEL0065]
MSDWNETNESFLEIQPQRPPKPAPHPQFEANVFQREKGRERAKQWLILDPKTHDKLHYNPSEFHLESDSPLSRPVVHSSIAIKSKLASLQNLKITETAKNIWIPKEEIKSVQSKLTRTLNSSLKGNEFSDLAPLSKPPSSSQTQQAPAVKKIHRAKISVDESWKAAKETKPSDFLAINQRELEVDSISIPYPLLSYSVHNLLSSVKEPRIKDSRRGKAINHGILNPVLSISSMALNFEDSHCSEFFEKPLRVEDFR